jgi:hypothetical protein
MSAALKFTLGRLGLFLLVFVLLILTLPLNIFVAAMIALVVSFGLSFFLLAKWREEMGEQLAGAAGRRAAEKERLRAALAGDEAAAAAGDRVERRSARATAEQQVRVEQPAKVTKDAEADQS